MTTTIHHGDALGQLRKLPGGSVDCCVTSPPYWALRDYGVEGQIGLEETPGEWCAKLVDVFREVRRTLKPTGTLWLNCGDSYISNSHGYGATHDPKYPTGRDRSVERNTPFVYNRQKIGLKDKDMVGQPWMLAFALRADGWYLRRDIVWHKPNAMPESVRDRPATAHEYVFLLSKSETYYYDFVASMEPTTGRAHRRGHGVNPKCRNWQDGPGAHNVITFNRDRRRVNGPGKSSRMLRDRDPRHDTPAARNAKQNRSFSAAVSGIVSTRNSRSVWSIPTAPYREAHFATFPIRLAERCIIAGSSEHGCCSWCGAPWHREVEVAYSNSGNRSSNGPRSAERAHIEHGSAGFDQRLEASYETRGWRPSCPCTLANSETVPAVVLDPFAGAATTLLAAERMARDAIGIELKAEYIAMAEARIMRDREKRASERVKEAAGA